MATPKRSGCYVSITVYDRILVPVENIALLDGAIKCSSRYENGKTRYELSSDDRIDMTLITAEEMEALRVAKKLES